MDHEQVDVCIVGAGPVGGALACRLAEAGLSVAVIDRAALPPMEHPAFDGRAYAIAAGSRALLEQAGLWSALPQAPCPIEQIRVSDGRLGRPASPLFLHFDVAELGQPECGAFGWMMEARALRVALNTRLNAGAGLRVFAPARARVTRRPDAALVEIGGGPTLRCALVVAAEGRESQLRGEAGIPVTRLPYGQTGIVSAIAHERPHQNIALEHFLPSGPFAQLPMAASEAGPHVSAIVWTERRERATHYLGLDDDAFGAEIGRRLGSHLGAVRPVGRRWSYPLGALHAHRYWAERLVVVGDAAHGVHPIAGQGLNLGLRDAGALAGFVIDAWGRGEDLGGGSVLRRYQAARRGDNLLMLAATDGLDRLFSSDHPVLRGVRGIGLAGVQRLPGLKRMFMRRAMGL